MMLAAELTLIAGRGSVLAQCVLDDRARDMLQPAAGPHRVELHLAGAFQVIKAVIGLGHGLADNLHAVIGHKQDFIFRSEHGGQPFTVRRIESEPGVVRVIGDAIEETDFGLSDRLNMRFVEPGQSAGKRHMGVQRASRARQQPVDRPVNAECR